MQLSNIPAKIAAIFAASAPTGSKNTIPLTQAGIAQPGQASYDVGFPSITMQPAASGGINPYGQDFNGLGFALSAPLQWLCAGGLFSFDATFAGQIGGYPKGSILQNATGDGFWLSTADNNSANPDTGGANWVALDGYGITAVTGLTNANVTLTAPQSSKKIITLAGTLTGNVQIIFPATQQQWLIVNNTTGSFAVTCKTAGGAGAIVQQGASQIIWGDGTNIYGTFQPQVSVQGSRKNLKIAAIGINNTNAVVTADEVVLETATGLYKVVKGVNLTINSAGTVGQPLSLSTGTLASGTFYHIWLWDNGTTTTGTLDPSATAPTAPAGYANGYRGRMGAVVTDLTANKYLMNTIQVDRIAHYIPLLSSNTANTPIIASGTNGTINSTLVQVSLSGIVPATAVRANIGAYTSQSGSTQISTDAVPVIIGGSGATSQTAPGNNYEPYWLLLEGLYVYWASNGSANRLCANGWEDAL